MNDLTFIEELRETLNSFEQEYFGSIQNNPDLSEEYKYNKHGIITGLQMAIKLFESKDQGEPMVYLIDLSRWNEDHDESPRMLFTLYEEEGNKGWIKAAEEYGEVYTLDEFSAMFNDEQINEVNSFIRIIPSPTPDEEDKNELPDGLSIFNVLDIDKGSVPDDVIKWLEDVEPYMYMDTMSQNEHIYVNDLGAYDGTNFRFAENDEMIYKNKNGDWEAIPESVDSFLNHVRGLCRDHNADYWRIISV